ncbi:hypothetical protein HZS_2060 [Henneguya salminicola]|nr:hypothetical protein HZS_2060 [Henneguya salminicola]
MNDAITYVQTFLVERENLKEFWSYILQTWLIRFNPSLWNVSKVESAEMVHRTNNARLNENFSNAHPNLYAFVEVNKQEFKYYQERCTDVRQKASVIIFRHPQNTQNQQLANSRSFINRGNN